MQKDVNAKNASWLSLLHLAAFMSDVDLVKALITHWWNIMQTDLMWNYPFDKANKNLKAFPDNLKYKEICDLLVVTW